MAALADKVNKSLVRKDGKLVEQATPTSQLAGQAGLSAPPTLPGGVAALGGTAQQQAMAGSVAQKQSALRQSLDTSTSLNEAEADKRYRASATADEQKKLDSQKRLGEVFGGTQQKVQDLINAEMNKQVAPATRLDTTGALKALPGAPSQADVDSAFSMLVSGVQTQGNINKLVQLTGMNADQIAAAAQDAATRQLQNTAGNLAAGSISGPESVNVTTLLPQLGTNREELSGLLGVDPTVIDTMTLDQLNAAVAATASQGGASVAETRAASQSSDLGAAERAGMREAARGQSTTGQAASEAQLGDLARSLQNADTVTFAGKNYTVKELLSDDNISQLVSDYVMAAPGSEIRKRLEGDPNASGLLNFVHKYQDTLKDAAGQVGTATTENTNIQSSNKQLAQVSTNVAIPDQLMKALYGDKWGTAQESRLPPTGFVKAIQDMPPAEREQIAGPLSEAMQMAVSDEAVQQDLVTMNKEQLENLFGGRTSQGITPWEKLKQTRNQTNALNESKGNIDALVNMYFNGEAGAADLPKMLSSAAKRKYLGQPYPPFLAALDADQNGIVDPNAAASLYDTILANLANANTPRKAMNNGPGFVPFRPPGALTADEIAAYNAGDTGAYSAQGHSGFAGAGTNIAPTTETFINPFTGVVTTTKTETDQQKINKLNEAQAKGGLPEHEKTLNPITGVYE